MKIIISNKNLIDIKLIYNDIIVINKFINRRYIIYIRSDKLNIRDKVRILNNE